MKITILSWGGHEFSIEVRPQEPVEEIKRKIEQVLGLPPKFQFLSVHGWELMDGLDMEDYPIITEGTKINLRNTIKYIPSPFNSQPSKIFIIVKFSARQIQIEVDMFETVRTLKEKIHIVDGTPVKRMSLFFSGVELEDDYRNIREYGIRESSEIVVFLKTINQLNDKVASRLLNISVQTFSSLLSGATIPLETKDSSNAKELREFLLSRKILPPDDYLFIHNQRIMRDELSLRWHGVEDGDILYVFKGTLSPSCR